MKEIPGEFKHTFVVADIDKIIVRNIVTKTRTEGIKISLLKGLKIGKSFQEK